MSSRRSGEVWLLVGWAVAAVVLTALGDAKETVLVYAGVSLVFGLVAALNYRYTPKTLVDPGAMIWLVLGSAMGLIVATSTLAGFVSLLTVVTCAIAVHRQMGAVVWLNALGVGTIVIAIVLLVQIQPKVASSSGRAIGVMPPASEGNKRFAVGLSITVTECEKDVRANLVIGGSREYWKANGIRTRAGGKFTVVLPGKVKLGTEIKQASGQKHHVNAYSINDPSVLAYPILLRNEFAGDRPQPVATKTRYAAFADATIVEGFVQGWGRKQNPVVIPFAADWTEHRDLSSCFVDLPALAGEEAAGVPYSASSTAVRERAQRLEPGQPFVRFYEGNPKTGDLNFYRKLRYVPAWDPVAATTTLIANKGQVLIDVSQPWPNDSAATNPTWLCAPPPLDEVLNGSGRRDLPTEAFLSSGSEDCRALAVIEQDDVWHQKDFLLTLIGLLAGLGLTLIIEAFMFAPAREED